MVYPKKFWYGLRYGVESGSFRSYKLSARFFQPDFWGESFRLSWGGSFRPYFIGGSFRPDFWGELLQPDLFILEKTGKIIRLNQPNFALIKLAIVL